MTLPGPAALSAAPALALLAAPLAAQDALYVRDDHGGFQTKSLAVAGDVDADGHLDLVYGGQNGGQPTVVLSGRTGALLHAIESPGTYLGFSVAGAGDVDADGHADVVLGGPLEPFAKAAVHSGADGTRLHLLVSPLLGDLYGEAVSGVDDVDGDGHDDFAVGAPGLGGRIEVRSGRDASLLYEIADAEPAARLGSVLAPIADLDGDGIGDLLAGLSASGEWEGGVRAYSGATGALVRAYAPQPELGANLGVAVADAGDVDGDGVPDVLAGATPPHGSGETGYALLFSGATGDVLVSLVGEHPGDFFGIAVAGVGDVDGDGVRDLAVGASEAVFDSPMPPGPSGFVRVHSGVDGALLLALAGDEPTQGFGRALAAPGDLNGDGVPELAIGAPYHPSFLADPAELLVVSTRPLALAASAHTVPLAGGAVALELRAGPAHAGEPWLLLGSLSGIAPGVAVGATALPLNPDALTTLLLGDPTLLAPAAGVLDAAGAAGATLQVPPLGPAHAGLVLDVAGLVFDGVLSAGTAALATNAAAVAVVP